MASQPSVHDNLTLFTTCKPFAGTDGIMQENALRSWHALGFNAMILGDERGAEGMAQELGFTHVKPVERSEKHIPYIPSLFEQAAKNSSAAYLAYINSDILLTDASARAVAGFLSHPHKPKNFLYVARRRNIPLSDPLFGTSQDWQERLQDLDTRYGTWDDVFAIDFFLFNRGWLKDIPPLTVGRAGWDNWMLYNARQCGIDVVDGSYECALFHPLHGYSMKAGGLEAVTTGPQARGNRLFCGDPICTIANSATKVQKAGQIIDAASCAASSSAPFTVDVGKRFFADVEALSNIGLRDKSQMLDHLQTILWRAKVTVPPLASSCHDLDTDTLIGDIRAQLSRDDIKQAINLLQDHLGKPFLAKLSSITRTEGRAVYIWGKGTAAKRLMDFLSRHSLSPDGIIDGLKESKDSERFQYDGLALPVLSRPDAQPLLAKTHGKPYVLVASVHKLDISQSLVQMGLRPVADFI